MTVIQRDCHRGSVCFLETVLVFQEDGRQVVCSPLKEVKYVENNKTAKDLIWHFEDEMVIFCGQFSLHLPLSTDLLLHFRITNATKKLTLLLTSPPEDQMSFKTKTLLLSFTAAHFLRLRMLSGNFD